MREKDYTHNGPHAETDACLPLCPPMRAYVVLSRSDLRRMLDSIKGRHGVDTECGIFEAEIFMETGTGSFQIQSSDFLKGSKL
jgi:hypothetical protein